MTAPTPKRFISIHIENTVAHFKIVQSRESSFNEEALTALVLSGPGFPFQLPARGVWGNGECLRRGIVGLEYRARGFWFLAGRNHHRETDLTTKSPFKVLTISQSERPPWSTHHFRPIYPARFTCIAKV